MTTVVVAGAVANKPLNGGGAWSRLTLVRGLLRLGVDAYLIEELPANGALAGSQAVAFFHRAVSQLGLDGRAGVVVGSGREAEGLAWDNLVDIADAADLLLNVSGHLRRRDLFARFRRRAYLDLDPGFTQFWEANGSSGGNLRGHDVHFTVGAHIGTPGCPIPTCGIEWRATRQMVLLDDWPVATSSADGFSTVSSWRGPFGPIDSEGRRYGLKAHAFRAIVQLPRLVGEPFELALDIHHDEVRDIELLERHGWSVVDPRAVAGDPLSFRRYVQRSRAEFSVAQGVYVETGSGWFSDRTARYLASGRPALVQDTGFSRLYPTGLGLVPFRTLEEAVAGAASIAGDYAGHAEAARELAERYFDAEVVLARLLEEAGLH